jgi:hypothetical protein
MAAIVDGLANRNHSVSIMVGAHFPLDVPELMGRQEITIVKYNDTTQGVVTNYEMMLENVTTQMLEYDTPFSQLKPHVQPVLEDTCRQWAMGSETMLDNLENEHFDLAVVDSLFFLKCIYLIPHRLHIPWVTYCDMVDPLLVRAPWLPSFIPHALVHFSDKMTFIERLKNVAINAVFSMNVAFPDPPVDIIRKYQQYGSFSCMDELIAKSKMWLIAKETVLDYPRPMMPNMAYIGGLTVRRSLRHLPPDIQDFVDGAKNGVILVSFGSSFGSSFPAKIARKFLAAFGRLEGFRILWRLTNKDNLELPDNLLIKSWLPQNAILAHPRVKLFITHCGNNGQFEAIYHGVPMIGFPIVGDQVHSAIRLDYKGYGISMDIKTFTTELLIENINKILTTKSYKDSVVKASEIFRSQPLSPVERATFWIEHVCKFGGDHLHSAGNDLPIYSYLMLDVLGVVLITMALAFWALLKFIKHVFRFLYNRKVKSD